MHKLEKVKPEDSFFSGDHIGPPNCVDLVNLEWLIFFWPQFNLITTCVFFLVSSSKYKPCLNHSNIGVLEF